MLNYILIAMSATLILTLFVTLLLILIKSKSKIVHSIFQNKATSDPKNSKNILKSVSRPKLQTLPELKKKYGNYLDPKIYEFTTLPKIDQNKIMHIYAYMLANKHVWANQLAMICLLHYFEKIENKLIQINFFTSKDNKTFEFHHTVSLHGQEDNAIRIDIHWTGVDNNNKNHYEAIINGKTQKTLGDGSCFYHAFLTGYKHKYNKIRLIQRLVMWDLRDFTAKGAILFKEDNDFLSKLTMGMFEVDSIAYKASNNTTKETGLLDGHLYKKDPNFVNLLLKHLVNPSTSEQQLKEAIAKYIEAEGNTYLSYQSSLEKWLSYQQQSCRKAKKH